MLKGLVNLFKCCKSQNRQNRETQETINYRDTEKNQDDVSNKNVNGSSSQKSLTSKNTTENSTPNKTPTPEPNLNKNEIDIGSCNIHYQCKFNNTNQEKKNDKTGKQEADLVRVGKDFSDNYATNDNLIQIPNENQSDDNKVNYNGRRVDGNQDVEEDFDKIIVPDKYIREEEKDCLVWSKNGIIDFINKIKNLDEFTEIKTKEAGLDIRIRKSGSELNKSIYIVKGVYKVSKKEFADGMTMEYMKDLIYIPELRMSWDDGYKEFKKLEGNSEVYALRSWLKSPMFIISERDVIDKRIEFFKGTTYYNFASSLNDSFFPEQKGVVRCKNYLNIFIAEQDEEFYYFTSMIQTDIKMNLPQSILNITVPSRLVSWYKSFIQIANKAYLETKEKMAENQI